MKKVPIIHPRLTRAERIVCQYYFLGYNPIEIGEIMGINQKTASNHLLNVASKYGRSNGTHYCPRQLLPALKDRDRRERLFLKKDFDD